jgi:hypothetical protein
MIVADSQEVMSSLCSDCGREAQGLIPAFDPHTNSVVALCRSCRAAFAQREQFPPGCCG